MKLEDEINKALAIVQEAAREGRLECRKSNSNREWRKWIFNVWLEYRAKPDPVERWCVIDGDDRYWETFRTVEGAENYQEAYGGRIVHLQEVE